MSEINQRVVCNGVDFQSIQNTNFKTMRISVHFMLPIDKNHISANAVLPALLCRASKQYPDYTKLSRRKPQCRGAKIGGYAIIEYFYCRIGRPIYTKRRICFKRTG